MLSMPAFNALLKILEEPPEHLAFILATTELNKVPATILSRCQRHSFKRLDTESIVGRLQYVAGQEQLDLTPEAAALIAGLSEGGMRDALSILDQCSGREKIDIETVYSAIGLAGNREIAELLKHIAAHDTAAAIALFAKLWQNGKDPATLLGELSTLERDILMRTVAPKGGRELLSGGYDEALLDEFRKVFPTGTLVNHIGILQTALADMRAGQAKTVCELALITLCEPELSDTLPALRERVEVLEQALRSGVPAQKVDIIQNPTSSVKTPPEEIPFDLPAQKAAAPAPAPTPAVKPEPVAAPASVSAGDDFWAQMQPDINRVFPVGPCTMLCDPATVSGVLEGDTLTLRVQTEFAKTSLDRPDNLQKLSAIAAKLRGRPTQVKFVLAGPTDPPAAGAADKLSALEKFGIVKFQ